MDSCSFIYLRTISFSPLPRPFSLLHENTKIMSYSCMIKIIQQITRQEQTLFGSAKSVWCHLCMNKMHKQVKHMPEQRSNVTLRPRSNLSWQVIFTVQRSFNFRNKFGLAVSYVHIPDKSCQKIRKTKYIYQLIYFSKKLNTALQHRPLTSLFVKIKTQAVISSNDRTFGHPIIYKVIYSQCYFVHCPFCSRVGVCPPLRPP